MWHQAQNSSEPAAVNTRAVWLTANARGQFCAARGFRAVCLQYTRVPTSGQPPLQRIEIHKLRQGDNLILGFSIGGGIDQDPTQNPFSEDKTDKGIYVTRVTEGGPAEVAGLQIGDKIMQVNGWDMTMVTHDQARKRLTKRNEEVVRLLVTRQSLQKAVQQSMMS
ncbi:tax1-binding protein 3 [Manacus vitellinus]|uniref:tax1-binding protein 3 n=1 Tax=Manacus vitellinus TaxID=328815 RepID=UPI00115DE525|nr:tax1-binding protein 3 [Manacus vitellinus]